MEKKRISSVALSSIILKILISWFLISFIIFPNLNLLISTFYIDGEFQIDAFNKIFESKRALKSLINSVVLAISLAISVNIVGILVVLFSEYFDIKGSKILKMGYMTSLIYGGVTLVVGYKFVYGNNGILTNLLINIFPQIDPNWFVGYGAVLFIMTFACTSNHIIFLTSAIREIDYHIIEASKNMGASSLKTFFRVVFPTLKPTLFAITILTFLTGLSALSAPLIVGGTDFQTINPMIITFSKTSYSREIAAVLSIFLGILTMILLYIFTKIEQKGKYMSISKTKIKLIKQKIENPILNFGMNILAWFIWIIYMLPVVLVILFSFSDSTAIKTATLSLSTLSFDNYKKLFLNVDSFKPYLVSIVYSMLAAIIGAIITVIVAKIVHNTKNKANKIFEYILLLPWLLPATLIALGLITTYNVSRAIVFNKVLVGSSVIMLIGYIVVKLPFSYKMIKASLYGVNYDLEEASKNMGASSFYTMKRVILPIIMPVILSVIVINFNGMLADYDLSIFLYNPFLQPLGIVIKSASDETASLDAQAMSFVYSTIIMIISTISLYLTQGSGIEDLKKRFKKIKKY